MASEEVTTADDVASMGEWNAFSAPDEFQDLADISQFALIVSGRFDVVWLVESIAVEAAQLIYDRVAEVLRESGLHRVEQLRFEAAQDVIRVSYQDDRYQFDVVLRGDSLTVRRGGSSLQAFHRWYLAVAPHFGLLAEKIFDAVGQVVKNHTRFDFVFKPTRAEYQFHFIAYDFVKGESGAYPSGATPVKNVEVLEQLIPSAPGEGGALAKMVDEREAIGRADFKIFRHHEAGERKWSEVYDVQAPGNRDWTSIWFVFSLVGDSRDDEASLPRIEFDNGIFLADYVTPLVDFLRGRAVCGFLGDVLDGYRYRTVSGQLP